MFQACLVVNPVRWYVLRTTQNGDFVLLPFGVSRPAGAAAPVRVVVSFPCSGLVSSTCALLWMFILTHATALKAVSFKTVISTAPSSTFRHRFTLVDGAEMANVEQTQKMVPLITCEITLCQYVCELVLGVNVFDLDFGVQIDSIAQPIKRNSVGSGNTSHCRASSLYDHLDHCFVVFRDIQHSFLTKNSRLR